MKVLKYILGVVFIIIIAYNVEASETNNYTLLSLPIGEKYAISNLEEDNEDGCSFIIDDESIVYISDGYLIPLKPGTTYIHKYFNDSLSKTYRIDVTFEEGYYRVYTIDSTGNKCYLTMNDKYPEGSSLCLNNKKYRVDGINKYTQIWRINEVFVANSPNDKVDYYTLAPSVSLDTCIRLDGGGAMVYLESLRYCYENDSYNAYIHNQWYFESSNGGFMIKSNRLSYEKKHNEWVSIIKSLHNDSEKNIVYAADDDESSVKWYFEKVNSISYFLQLYDMYEESYTVVTDRWMGIDSTKNLEELEVFLAICSSSSTKEEVLWSSSNESVATVDVSTGEVTAISAGDVTITVQLKNDESVKRSYLLHVENFEDGVYYLKNTDTNQYLSAEITSAGYAIALKDSVNHNNAKWKISLNPNGLYGIYLLNSSERDLFLTPDNSEELIIDEFYYESNPTLRDTSIWKIVKESINANEYSIAIPYMDVDIEYYNYICIEPGTNEVLFADLPNSFYVWELMKVNASEYEECIEFCYDNAFVNRYNGLNNNPLFSDILNLCKNTLCKEFFDEFNISLSVTYENIESFADICKKVNGLDYDDMCPSNPSLKNSIICSNMRATSPPYYCEVTGSMDCTDEDVACWEFRPYTEDGYENPAAYFCGHRLYNDMGNPTVVSYFEPRTNVALIYTLPNKASDFANTIIHEFGHCFGAPDHYHRTSTDGTTQNCRISCSTCGLGAYRRSKTCVMNCVYKESYEWCEDCLFDIKYTLNNRYDVN